jgi:hypothetical protein
LGGPTLQEGLMAKKTRILTIALALALVASASAYARPIGGKTYLGGIPATGYKTEGHHAGKTHANGGLVSLRVAHNGRSVVVRFTSSWPVLYCYPQKLIRVQSGKPARISSSGSFTANVEERFNPGPGLPPIVEVIRGRFKGRVVTGKIETRAPPCSGWTTFYATAQGH